MVGWYVGQEFEGVVIVVVGVDENVVDVQKQVVVGFGEYGVDEVDFVYVCVGNGVVGDVFYGDVLVQYVLCLGDVIGDMVYSFGGEWQWQQVVDMVVGSVVVQVFVVQLYLVQVEEGMGLCQQGVVQWIRIFQ